MESQLTIVTIFTPVYNSTAGVHMLEGFLNGTSTVCMYTHMTTYIQYTHACVKAGAVATVDKVQQYLLEHKQVTQISVWRLPLTGLLQQGVVIVIVNLQPLEGPGAWRAAVPK